MAEAVSITVDGKPMQVPAGEVLIKACEDSGIYIPRFCWHKRMKPVGMCRMCLVEIEGLRGTALITSCTEQVAEQMVVHTQSDAVKKAQEGVLEFLLINHPLDCPVCDRGGECPLQDHTMAFGPGESRFVEEKRHFEKPIPISELVMLDRERCILCARCTRFSDEISGDPLIEFMDRGYGTQVLTFPDEPFTSYFSGNTVEICPVGALTATPYRFRARPWDLEAVESTCSDCSVGCRVSVQASQNEVLRMNGVDSDPTNQGWLCDKGRFAFDTIDSPHRLAAPLVKGEDGQQAPAEWSEALSTAAQRLGDFGPGEIAGLGGARSTNEEAYAFGKFLRTVAATPHLDAQLGDGLNPQMLAALTPRARMDDLESAASILVWGPDLKEELPVLYLRVRRAAQELGARLVVVHPRRTGLDDVVTRKVVYRPGEGPEVLARLAEGGGEFRSARAALKDGPVVALVGRTGLGEDPRLAEAVAAFARDLPEAKLMPLARRSNVFGAVDMGLAPVLLPGRVSAMSDDGVTALEQSWGPLPEAPGKDAHGILRAAAEGEVKALVLLGSDPMRDFPDHRLATEAFESCRFVLALDTFPTDSTALADVVAPVKGFAEAEGTVTNLEGRVQKVNAVVSGPAQARPAWAVLEDLANRMGSSVGAGSAAVLAEEIAMVAPAYRGVSWDGLGRDGMVVPGPDAQQPLTFIPVDAGLEATGGDGLALHLGRVLYDDGVRVRYSVALSRLAVEGVAHLHPEDAGRIGVGEGDMVLVSVNGSSATLSTRFDDSLAPGSVYVPFNTAATAGLGSGTTASVEAAN